MVLDGEFPRVVPSPRGGSARNLHMGTVTVSQPSQIAISLFGECFDTPVIFCVSNDNDVSEAVTPVTDALQESKETVTVSQMLLANRNL